MQGAEPVQALSPSEVKLLLGHCAGREERKRGEGSGAGEVRVEGAGGGSSFPVLLSLGLLGAILGLESTTGPGRTAGNLLWISPRSGEGPGVPPHVSMPGWGRGWGSSGHILSRAQMVQIGELFLGHFIARKVEVEEAVFLCPGSLSGRREIRRD